MGSPRNQKGCRPNFGKASSTPGVARGGSRVKNYFRLDFLGANSNSQESQPAARGHSAL